MVENILIAAGGRLHSRGPLFAVAPPMDSLNVIGMIASPRSAHAAGIDIVGHNIAVIGELFFAEGTFTNLDDDLPVEKLPHFTVGPELPVPSKVMRIFDLPNTQLALPFVSRNCLPAAAQKRTMNRTQSISPKPHDFLLIGFGGL